MLEKRQLVCLILSSNGKRQSTPWVWVSCSVEVDVVGFSLAKNDEISDLLSWEFSSRGSERSTEGKGFRSTSTIRCLGRVDDELLDLIERILDNPGIWRGHNWNTRGCIQGSMIPSNYGIARNSSAHLLQLRIRSGPICSTCCLVWTKGNTEK
jgi:hypothetical protein